MSLPTTLNTDVSDVEYGKVEKLYLEHIHHIRIAETVDEIAYTSCNEQCKSNVQQLRAAEYLDQQYRAAYDHKGGEADEEPSLSRHTSEYGAVVLEIGKIHYLMAPEMDKVHGADGLQIMDRPVFHKLVCSHKSDDQYRKKYCHMVLSFQ